MRARNLLPTLSVLAALALAGCTDDGARESAEGNDTLGEPAPDGAAACLEGAPDCDDTPTMETVEDPDQVGT